MVSAKQTKTQSKDEASKNDDKVIIISYWILNT